MAQSCESRLGGGGGEVFFGRACVGGEGGVVVFNVCYCTVEGNR